MEIKALFSLRCNFFQTSYRYNYQSDRHDRCVILRKNVVHMKMCVVKKYFSRLVILELLEQSFEQMFVYTA